MSQKPLTYIIGAAAAVAIFLLGWSYATAPTVQQLPAGLAVSHTVNFLLDDGAKVTGYQNVKLPSVSTVLGVLEEVAAEKNLTLVVDKSSPMGAFIKQIGEQKNGAGGKYWQYWVGGAQPMVAADKYKLVGGETILWTFRKSAL